jgi:hypothetical protein
MRACLSIVVCFPGLLRVFLLIEECFFCYQLLIKTTVLGVNILPFAALFLTGVAGGD